MLQVLDMFDPGITNLINGQDIDRAFNALTLTPDMHHLFGSLHLNFEPIPAQKHTYVIRSVGPFMRSSRFPLVRTLLTAPNKTIDPPSPRLLAIHRACSMILHLSGAGNYIECVLRDEDAMMVEADGSTELGPLLLAKLWHRDIAVS